MCDDGVTIAKAVSLKDPEEDMGVQLLREPAERTQGQVGDGTTTATLLARAIFAEGIVPGAGLAFLRAVGPVLALEQQLEGDERTGARIVRGALEVVTRTIAENSGVDAGVVVDKLKNGTGAFGFDAATATYGDLYQLGIIDPVKVLRLALQNAVSSASTLLLTDATLVEVPEPQAKPPGPGGLGEGGFA